MAKNGKQKGKDNGSSPKLKTETKHGIMAVVFFVLALFLLMSAFNWAGVAGVYTYKIFSYLLGVGYIFLPALFILLGASCMQSNTPNFGFTRTISSLLFLLSTLGIVDIVSKKHSGGLLGKILSKPFLALFDTYASIALLGAILLISLLIMFDTRPALLSFLRRIWGFFTKKKEVELPPEVIEAEEIEEMENELKESAGEKIKNALGVGKKTKKESEEEEEMPIKKRRGGLVSTYVPPPLSLLEEDKGKPNTGDIKETGLKQKIRLP